VTDIIKFSFSETENAVILGRDLLRVKAEDSFEGNTVYTVITLWKYYGWNESDGDNSDKVHKGCELFTGAYADFNWVAWYKYPIFYLTR